jgi:hypothetical protein
MRFVLFNGAFGIIGGNILRDTNNTAFKEWAAICAALGEGLQTLIIRKGGIAEGRDGFRVAQPEFWLFPTYLHEAAHGLEEGVRPILDRVEAQRPPPGILCLAHYAVVTDVCHVLDEQRLSRLAGEHVWSPRTVGERFAYRRPGLFVLTVRVYVREEPHVIPDSPHFAGCRSWVDLPLELSTDKLRPALSDEEFDRGRQKIHDALNIAFT